MKKFTRPPGNCTARQCLPEVHKKHKNLGMDEYITNPLKINEPEDVSASLDFRS